MIEYTVRVYGVESSGPGTYWYRNDQLHREDDAAVEQTNGIKRWYLDGNQYTETEWKAELARRNAAKTPQQTKPSLDGKIVEIDGAKYKLASIGLPKLAAQQCACGEVMIDAGASMVSSSKGDHWRTECREEDKPEYEWSEPANNNNYVVRREVFDIPPTYDWWSDDTASWECIAKYATLMSREGAIEAALELREEGASGRVHIAKRVKPKQYEYVVRCELDGEMYWYDDRTKGMWTWSKLSSDAQPFSSHKEALDVMNKLYSPQGRLHTARRPKKGNQ